MVVYDNPQFRNRILDVKNEIDFIKNSGKYYTSNDINNELDAIDDGLNHLRLEGNIQDTSSNLRNCIRSEIGQSAEVAKAVDKAASFLSDYRDFMGTRNVATKQENQLRELHQWALLSLKDVQNSLVPHTYGTWKRLHNYKDDVGVTDMYTGIRNNICRPREPCEPNSHWTGKPSERFVPTKSGQIKRPQTGYDSIPKLKERPGKFPVQGPPVEWTGDLSRTKLGRAKPKEVGTVGYRTIDSLYPRSTVDSRLEPPDTEYHQSIENLRPATIGPHITYPPMKWTEKPKTLQEASGINMTFPGTTEYMKRFSSPSINRLGGGFTINPNPDFNVNGRRLADMKFYNKSTEYDSRYTWPSCDLIDKFPWLRK